MWVAEHLLWQSRGHRLCVFDTRFAVAGVSVGVHRIFGNMVAIEFAAEFEDDPAAGASRLVSNRE